MARLLGVGRGTRFARPRHGLFTIPHLATTTTTPVVSMAGFGILLENGQGLLLETSNNLLLELVDTSVQIGYSVLLESGQAMNTEANVPLLLEKT